MNRQKHIEDCKEIIKELRELISQTNDINRIEDLNKTIKMNEQAIKDLESK